jgi:hypothetical protein
MPDCTHCGGETTDAGGPRPRRGNLRRALPKTLLSGAVEQVEEFDALVGGAGVAGELEALGA